MPINCKYNKYLSRIFSGPSIQTLATDGRCDFISSVVKSSGILDELRPVTTWESFFEKTYSYLFNNYRNEYVYKNAIANKILLGRHSLNTSNLLTEFRVDKSKADIVILNGTSSVYEIKSEFDSFERLEEQIRSYRKVFGFINVITHRVGDDRDGDCLYRLHDGRYGVAHQISSIDERERQPGQHQGGRFVVEFRDREVLRQRRARSTSLRSSVAGLRECGNQESTVAGVAQRRSGDRDFRGPDRCDADDRSRNCRRHDDDRWVRNGEHLPDAALSAAWVLRLCLSGDQAIVDRYRKDARTARC